MWYEKTNQATQARSWNLSDDLGQIEYIISDKTGTLTQVCYPDLFFSHSLLNLILESYGVQKMHNRWECV